MSLFWHLASLLQRRRGPATVASLLIGAGVVWALWPHQPSQDELVLGELMFTHRWQVDDELSSGGDGLGPVFNDHSCVACHFKGGVGGAGAKANNVLAFEAMPTLERANVVSGVVHAFATDVLYQESRDSVARAFPIVPKGARVSGGCFIDFEDFDPVNFVQINAPALFGAGLIDDISGWTIVGNGARRSMGLIAEELSGDFSGTPPGRSRMLSRGRVGKFGWKGQFASLEEFVASACAMEIGLTNSLQAQQLPNEYRPDPDAEPDMTSRQLSGLVQFVASLPRPVQVLPTDPEQRAWAERGEHLFTEIGCARCHTRDLGNVAGIYSDLRLYEIEREGSARYLRVEVDVDPPRSHPRPNEWKTPPLWGVADSAPYFHDGATPTLREAILRHDGHARQTRENFQRLKWPDRQAVVAFLKTLRAPGAGYGREISDG